MIEAPMVHVSGPPGHKVQDFECRSHPALLHELVDLNHAADWTRARWHKSISYPSRL